MFARQTKIECFNCPHGGSVVAGRLYPWDWNSITRLNRGITALNLLAYVYFVYYV